VLQFAASHAQSVSYTPKCSLQIISIGRRIVKKTTFLIKNREAVGDNAARVLNIDGGAPGRIYVCIDEAAQEEITHQFGKRFDTSNEIVPEREGYTVEVVTFNATLRELFTAEILPFDHEAQIEAWAVEE
jgi:hypothetical protein